MVVVHRAHGFKFVIYTQDHDPAHVHIVGPGQAKISLLPADAELQIVYSIGIKRSDMRRLLKEVEDNRARLLVEWERIHGKAE